jgi:hypothetical protein
LVAEIGQKRGRNVEEVLIILEFFKSSCRRRSRGPLDAQQAVPSGATGAIGVVLVEDLAIFSGSRGRKQFSERGVSDAAHAAVEM